MDTLRSLFESDADKSVKGVPIVVGYNKLDQEVVFWVAEVGNPNHIKAQRKYSKQFEVIRKNPKQTEKILKKIMAESILVDWKGVLDENGQEIKPTFDNKLDALTKYRKLYLRVLEESGDSDNFRLVEDTDDEQAMSPKEASEDTEKNLEAS